MNDSKWQSSIDILAAESGDLAKKPTPKEMYTNAIIEGMPEAQALNAIVKKATN
jgi:hypothetical protein